MRKPLTQVQEFSLHVNHRAVDRAQFDERVTKKFHILFIATLEKKIQKSIFFYSTQIAYSLQIKEKEMMYKRYREESEAARMVSYPSYFTYCLLF